MNLIIDKDVEDFEIAKQTQDLLKHCLILDNQKYKRVYLVDRKTTRCKSGKLASVYISKLPLGCIKPHPFRKGVEPFIVEWYPETLDQYNFLSSLEL